MMQIKINEQPRINILTLICDEPIGGLHCRHVGGQNKRKFAHIICIKMAVNSQRRKNLIVPVHQHGRHDVTCKRSIGSLRDIKIQLDIEVQRTQTTEMNKQGSLFIIILWFVYSCPHCQAEF